MNKLQKIIESYPPELKLLLVMCGSERWTKEELIKAVDWEVFLQWMKRHRVTPAVYRYLKEHGDGVPEGVVERIKENQNKITKRALLLTNELIRIGKKLEEENIPWFTMKGPVLALQLYNDLAGRDFRDLDIFVMPDDIEKVSQIMGLLNYKCINKTPLDKLKKVNHNAEFVNREGKVKVEIHWQLFSNIHLLPVDYNSLFTQTERINISGFDVKTTRKTFASYYFALHGTVHQWNELQWIKDLFQIQLEGLDFEIISDHQKSLTGIFESLDWLMKNNGDDNKNHSKTGVLCLKTLAKRKASVWDKVNKSFYLFSLSRSAEYKKELLRLRFMRLFYNPSKRINFEK
ncbi:MAG: hypothetical protein A2W91_07285 [Bacteroidetes bacterium GWF2_38_335]|nr:MAG: hypothetical protein A2W91_07285 [Bacteroidetes bacterium GWF2_38_335]OFY77131.1 MAG: hypothetical protein A2281_14520 [Bacteroidetes bacterium RIFOXYA12_FULL_38_20]HBS85022.1 hypothetical protein [Bacteroidales bacterium]